MYYPQPPMMPMMMPMMTGRQDDNKKKMMLIGLVVLGIGLWYYTAHYKSPVDLANHLRGVLDVTSLDVVQKMSTGGFVKYTMGQTGKFIWIAKEAEHFIAPISPAISKEDDLPLDVKDALGRVHTIAKTTDGNFVYVSK